MAIGSWPYSRLTEGMKGQDPDDDPGKLPQEDKDTNYGLWQNSKPTDATDDVGGAGWAQSETYRRLNCRGK